jgi:tRNA(adenine34) deaminase
VVFGAWDEKHGCSKTGQLFHPKTAVKGGVLETECGDLLRAFFQKKRK